MNQQKLLDKIKDDYEKIASEFSDTRIRPWPEMEEFRKYVKPGDKVLDLGCGNGRLYQIFKGMSISYVGIDLSSKLINIAKILYLKPKTQNPKPKSHVNFLVSDITKLLPFADNFFDMVFMVASFHHIPSKDLRKQVISEMKRVIKPGGLLIMTNWNLWQPKLIRKYKLWRLLFGLKNKGMDRGDTLIPWKLKSKEVIQRYYHAFTFRELKKLFQEIGWEIVEQYYVKQGERVSWLKGDNLVSVVKKLDKI